MAVSLVLVGCLNPAAGDEEETLGFSKAITTFSFADPAATGTIDEAVKTIAVSVPSSTNVTALVPSITYIGARISPESEVIQDVISPLTYTLTAADGTHQGYATPVTRALKPVHLGRSQWPLDETAVVGAAVDVCGRVYVEGLTDHTAGVDTHLDMLVQIGSGPRDSDPDDAPPESGLTQRRTGLGMAIAPASLLPMSISAVFPALLPGRRLAEVPTEYPRLTDQHIRPAYLCLCIR